VAWDRVSEIFNVECPLEAGCKESTEWSDERSKGGHYQTMDLEGSVLNDWCRPSKLDHQY